jgi:hypothetical protein
LNYLGVKDALWMSYFILNAIKNYHDMHGSSRGAFILSRDNLNTDILEEWIIPPGNLDRYKFIKSENDYYNKIQCLGLKNEKLNINWVNVRDVPSTFGWFETTWKKFKEDNIFNN